MPGLQQLPDLTNAGDLPTYLNQAIMNQVGTANQFNQLGLQQNQADLQAKTLSNLFAEQQNPQLLKQQALANEAAGFENVGKRITAEQREALAPEEKKAKAAEYLQKIGDAELTTFMSKAKLDMMSDDPALAKQGRNKYMLSAEEQSKRVKHQEEMEKTGAEIQGRKDVANISAAASRYATDKRGATAAGAGGSPWGKTFEQQVAFFADKALKAQAAGDQEALTEANNMLDLIQRAQGAKPAVQTQGMKTEGQIQLPGTVRTMPNTAPAPVQVGPRAQQPQAPAGGLADVQKMYPGVPAEKLKEAYKKKFGVDLK